MYAQKLLSKILFKAQKLMSKVQFEVYLGYSGHSHYKYQFLMDTLTQS